MLKEAILELEGEEIQLHIDKRDENLCKKLLSELKLNCEIVTDITCAGGLNASTKDGKFIVFNTIESRFERAKVLLKPEIFATLYGGQVVEYDYVNARIKGMKSHLLDSSRI